MDVFCLLAIRVGCEQVLEQEVDTAQIAAYLRAVKAIAQFHARKLCAYEVHVKLSDSSSCLVHRLRQMAGMVEDGALEKRLARDLIGYASPLCNNYIVPLSG